MAPGRTAVDGNCCRERIDAMKNGYRKRLELSPLAPGRQRGPQHLRLLPEGGWRRREGYALSSLALVRRPVKSHQGAAHCERKTS